MRLLCRKYHFLENSKNRIHVKKNFFRPNKKIRVSLLLIKNRKKIISFKSATSTVDLIWNDPSILSTTNFTLIFVLATSKKILENSLFGGAYTEKTVSLNQRNLSLYTVKEKISLY